MSFDKHLTRESFIRQFSGLHLQNFRHIMFFQLSVGITDGLPGLDELFVLDVISSGVIISYMIHSVNYF